MLELIDGFDEATIAIKASGEVTRDDYESVIIPKVKEILMTYEKVSCFMFMTAGTTYSVGALATDTALGLRHLFSWHRIAVVTDIEWIHKGGKYLLPLMPCEAKIFDEAEYDAAKEWLER